MDRLTNRNITQQINNPKFMIDMYNRLADYEDKIENGTLTEVVRCKDCKWSSEEGPDLWYCNHPDGIMPLGTSADSFCSYRERKENNEKAN